MVVQAHEILQIAITVGMGIVFFIDPGVLQG
jgi:hypothetical protein